MRIVYCLIVLVYSLCASTAVMSQVKYPAAGTQNRKQPASNPFYTGSLRPVAGQLSAAPRHRTCFTVESEQILQQKFPGRSTTEKFEERLLGRMASSSLLFGSQDVYKIPVIVHVIHNGEPVGSGTNISQQQVLSQFDALNDDFRRLGNGYNEHPSGADIQVEFVPALFDPQGRLLEEPGIDRVFGYSAYFEYYPIELELKPNTQWNPDQYLNIWVLNLGGDMQNVLGYAQLPTMSGLEGLPDDVAAETDGVVIGHRFFGTTENVEAPFNLGRTTTHEVGHWLGLRHIWGDGDCSVDDYCADTPNADGPNQTCTFRDSCPEDGPDMIENYMDYSDDGCMNIFTADQRARIRTVLEVSPRRHSLLACQLASPAIKGINLSATRQWFDYTASADEVVTISSIGTTGVDTKLSLFPDCNTLPINVSDRALGTDQSELSIALKAGETVKMLWQGDDAGEDFEWKLSVKAQIPAAACDLAVNAVTGNNHMPVTTLGVYWYKYIPSAENQKITIANGGKYFSVYDNTCDHLALVAYGNTAQTIYNTSPSEPIYIAFDAHGGNFNWSLTAQNGRAGERCIDAVPVEDGSYTIPYESPFQYWYSYTMPVAGQLMISSEQSGPVHLSVYKTCNGNSVAESEDVSTEPVTLNLAEGDIVKLAWTRNSGVTNFEWNLQAIPFTNGEVCSAAITAVKGMNTTGAAPQWFKYTTTRKSNLRISSVGMTEANTHLIIKRDCDGQIIYDNDDFNGAQSELILFGVEKGEKFLILWSEKWSYEGFSWVIEEIDQKAGDNCNTAKQAVVGTNTVNYNNGHANYSNIFWTRFKAPTSGKSMTAFASIPVDVAVYTTNNCETFTWVAEDQGKVQVFDMLAGQEILIIWDAADYTADFTWTITYEPTVAGDLCSKPIKAKQGLNTSAHTGVWYEYTMTHAGSLKFSATGLTDPPVVFNAFKGCGGEFIYSNYGDFDVKLPPDGLLTDLKQGDRAMIYWTTGYPFRGVTWSLEEIPPKKGDSCSDPLNAVFGVNHAEYATQWYTYTVPEPGNYTISCRAFTDNDTDLYVYDGCEGNLLAHNDGVLAEDASVYYFQSEALLENLGAGQTLLIKWAGTHSIYPFTWEISDENPRKGDSCEDPLEAIEGVNNAMKPNPSWFTFTMPRTASLTLTSMGYTNATSNFEIYDACNGNLLATDDGSDFELQSYVYLNELAAGQTILIKCFNDPFRLSDRHTFDWRLFVGEPDAGLFCSLPAEAHVGVNVTPAYTGTRYWYSFTMPAGNKKLVINRIGAPTTNYRQLGVTRGCDLFNPDEVYVIGEDRVEVSGLTEGEQVLIFWGDLTIGERPSGEWELTVTDLEPGDVCDLARDAWPGINNCDGPTSWYTYTLPRAGNVRISSHGLTEGIDTYLEVYDGCNGNLLASNDNPDDYSTSESEVLLENVEAGQTILIRWAENYFTQLEFNWRLTVEGADNAAPEIENTFFEVAPVLTTGQVIGTLHAEDADGDELHFRIMSGNNDNVFSLDGTSGVLSIANAALIPENGIARTMEVSVTDRIGSTNATVSIDVVTSVDDDTELFVKAYPNPAHDVLHLQVPAGIIIHRSYFTDLNGHTVVTNNPVKRDIALKDLTQGIYLLKLVTTERVYTLKIAVVR